MKEIPLTRGRVAIVDDDDYDWLSQHKWCAQKCVCTTRTIWYAVRRISTPRGINRMAIMHREIMPGVGPLDHRDGDGLNNRRRNLRRATRSQNLQNQYKQPGKTSRFKGVHRHELSEKWAANIGIGGARPRKHLGLFVSEEAAAGAYDEAARRLFGEFARLNFPP